jgi:hypothetical protein
MQKYEIVNALINRNHYRRYLEICTPTTGQRFSRIQHAGLYWRHRLMYVCPPGFQDGSEITFRSESIQISHLLDQSVPYDIIFIDPYHNFECSLRDLESALAILRPDGTLVVHDCCPPARELAGPSYRPGSWFGVTYCAFIEFVQSHTDLVYYTVDTDCGCGVVKNVSSNRTAPTPFSHDAELSRLWRLQKSQQQDMFDFFHQHRSELLNLISVEEFLSHEKLRLPPFHCLARWRERFSALVQA